MRMSHEKFRDLARDVQAFEDAIEDMLYKQDEELCPILSTHIEIGETEALIEVEVLDRGTDAPLNAEFNMVWKGAK